MKRVAFVWAFAWVALLAGGCTVGPSYEQPTVEMPTAWSGDAAVVGDEGEAVAGPMASPSVAWWAVFGDPQLSEMVERAVAGNHDIELARLRVREARAQRQAVAGSRWPSVEAGADYRRFRESETAPRPGQAPTPDTPGSGGQAGGGSQTANLFSVGFDASWEVDVFGGTRRRVEAVDAQVDAAVEGGHGTLLTVVGEVVRNYVELRGTQREWATLQETLRLQRRTLELVERRHAAGLSPRLDVTRAQSQVERVEADLPTVRSQLQAGAYRLAVLLGESPTALLDELLETEPVAWEPVAAPMGVPSELLRRRPDLRQAERELAAATAEVGVATAALYPRLFVIGSAGLESDAANMLIDAGSGVFAIGPSLSLPLFEGGRLRAELLGEEVRRDAAWVRLEQAVLLALEEVEAAAARYVQSDRGARRTADVVASTEQSAELALRLYEQGLSDFLAVLDAERELAEARRQQAQRQTAVMVELGALYKALGGGWAVDDE
ncbi:efflux transporter outer membrane subunit [Phycisphaerales bacterium AB-hyl4]|uniref:Efflux transporter outer membrane subunit n=1 Tax=Natronomicrosphaera hydrolytica TaxID=3242702 RepID=A0ABV4U272_9BACT